MDLVRKIWLKRRGDPKSRKYCRHHLSTAPKEECQYVWMDEDLLVEKEVMDLGFKYDFEPDASYTSHQCTYMDGNMGIV